MLFFSPTIENNSHYKLKKYTIYPNFTLIIVHNYLILKLY